MYADGGAPAAIFVALVAAYLLIGPFHEYLINESWIARVDSLRNNADFFYLISAIVSGAAALLLSGVVVSAPLLSLSLHQSHDSLFDLARIMSGSPATPAQVILKNNIVKRLREQLAFYQQWNPLYLATWLASVIFLAAMVIRIAWARTLGQDIFKEAIASFHIAGALVVVFAAISIHFFFGVKPGITKLSFYVEYLILMENQETVNRPKSVVATLRAWIADLASRMVKTCKAWATRYRSPSPKTSLLAFLAIVGIVLLVIWRLPPRKNEPQWPSVTVGINATAIASAPVLFAANTLAKSSDGSPIDLQLRRFASGRAALDALAAGNVDAATAAEFPVTKAAPDRKLRIIATIAKSPLKIVGRRSRGIAEPKDLAGKSIATIDGTSVDYFLSQFLKKHGIRAEKRNLQPADMVVAFERDKIDAICIWEPLASAATASAGNDAVVFKDESIYLEHFNLVTRADTLADSTKNSSLRHLVKLLRQASTTMKSDPDVAQSVVASELHVPVKQVTSVWHDFVFGASIDTSLTTTISQIEDWLSTLAARRPRAGFAKELIDDSLLRN